MAMSDDFEKRRRERMQRQRRKRERMRRIRLVVFAVIFLCIIIAIIVGIANCSGKDPATNTNQVSETVTATPSVQPTTAPNSSAIPAPEKGDNNLLDQLVASGQKKHVYLTFEDSPNSNTTPQILDVLRRYNVKATFFMTGRNIEKTPYICTRVVEEGHLAAVKSYSDDNAQLYASESSFMDEVDKTYQLIVANTPGNTEPFKVYRFPGGSDEDSSYGSDKQDYKDSLAEMGFYYCDWNTLIGDSENGDKTAQELMDYFDENRPDLNNLVIVLHDSVDKQSTVDMLPQLISKLLEEGYTFSRLDEIDYSNAPEPTASAVAENDEDSSSDRDSSSDSSSSDSSSSSSNSGNSSSSSSTSNSSSSKSSSSSSSSSSKSSTSSSSSSGSGATVTRTSPSGNTTTEEAVPQHSDSPSQTKQPTIDSE